MHQRGGFTLTLTADARSLLVMFESVESALQGGTHLSVVIPAFNEHDNVVPLCEEICDVLSRAGVSFEVIFVDDGSTDATPRRLATLSDDPRVVIVRLARNVGQSSAMAAGIAHARGRLIALLDADRQNDPAEIPILMQQYHSLAADSRPVVICGWRRHRQDGAIRSWFSRRANALISRTTGVVLHDYGCTLKLFPADLLKAIPLYGEMHRFIPVFAHWEGARIIETEVRHRPRVAGATHYGLNRTFRVLLDLATVQFLTRYRGQSMRFFGRWAWRVLGAGAVLALAGSTVWLSGSASRWPALALVAGIGMGLMALLLAGLGLLGEFGWRTHFLVRQSPPYRVAEITRGGESSLRDAPSASRDAQPASSAYAGSR